MTLINDQEVVFSTAVFAKHTDRIYTQAQTAEGPIGSLSRSVSRLKPLDFLSTLSPAE